MSERSVETSPQLYARIGGWLYLVTIVAGVFAEFFVRSKLIVSGDATATAHNIMASERLWRFGFAADLVGVLCYVAVTLILYVLLRPVNRDISLLAAFTSLVGCIILGFDGLAHFAPLLLLGGADYLKAFDQHQLQALALFSLKLHAYGYDLSIVFFSFYVLLLGYLIFRSGYLPKFLGVLLAIEFVCSLTNSLAGFLAPAFAATLPAALLAPGAVAESALCLWLIVMGVNVAKWKEKANLPAGKPAAL
ncbi:MAG: DUF4386 domain-containing protein [Candidatus Eremiobacter antarcticus]|nr:DUF4386 domain-containing protein [Candidatus Eremiobacteraeota bacterium]MBC5808857.1 DUF4386 domain-containing protein [Candidatus Eremiobacteraeota bacterium]PZR60456.1 MAG: DUF4386 domain-containing protein [Candidatus Eremiobacter sp. RRmetagenome_bin22]